MKFLKKDLIIMMVIIITPFLFFTYKFFPKSENYIFLNYTIYSGYYETIDVMVWSMFNCLLVIILFSLWFLTCRYWWRYLILGIILVEAIKFFQVIKDVYKISYFYSLLIIVPLLTILLILSIKVNYYSHNKSTNQLLDEEISSLINKSSNFNKKNYKKIKEKLYVLRKNKKELNKSEYLTELIKLKELT